MQDFLSSIGLAVKDVVLLLAGLLKFQSAPGLVTLVLMLTLAGLISTYAWTMGYRRRAASWLRALIDGAADHTDFSQGIDIIGNRIQVEGVGNARRQLVEAWTKYRETLVPYDTGGSVTFRHTVRPSVFFNTEELRFAAGSWRIVPGIFVSVGLFLTFLGLISALSSMELTEDKVQGSLRDLLTIASAKFIMSLTGLLCSIIFTVVLRSAMSGVERELHGLCGALEQRLTFISLEELAFEQLVATREQREHFRMIGLELVAELGRPLREELPAAISASISSAMGPLIQQVGQIGADGMGVMVKDLSARFSDDVGRALGMASESLIQAGDRIAELSGRMDQSSGRVGVEIDSAVARLSQAVEDLRNALGDTAKTASGAFTQGAEQLLSVMNETLDGIRTNTGEGARALSVAAAEMREAAQGFRAEIENAAIQGRVAAKEQIEAAGESAAGAIGSAGVMVLETVSRTTQEISERTEQQLLAPLDQIAGRLSDMVSKLSEGTTVMRRLSEGVRAGAEASEQAAGVLRTASQDLGAAISPIRTTNERIESAITQLKESTENAASTVVRSSQATAQSAAQILAAAQEALGGSSKAINASLVNLSAMLDRLKGQGERLDDIDGKLGKAFDEYTSRVATAVESLFGHVRKMNEELAPALDTLRSIVEQAEQFQPESRRQS